MTAPPGGTGGFRPSGQGDLAPAGTAAKIAANLEALRVLRRLGAENRPASQGELELLARWSGWGSAPELFDPDSGRYRQQAAELRSVLSEREWDAARRTTINAHYTSAEIVRAMWDTVGRLGFDPAGARVLEPGCGSGNFIGFAPDGVSVTGVELDPMTAAIAGALYPQAEIRRESFAETPLADGRFDLVIGNVPFSAAVLADRAHNRGRHSMHGHFIIKSLDLTRPGGLVAVVTSRFTLDAAGDAARREMAERADLIGAVRLPAGTFKASAGTDVVTDVVVLRRREADEPARGPAWRSVGTVDTPDGPVEINEYFAERPDMIAGRLGVGNGQYHAADPTVSADPDRPIAERFDRVVRAGHDHGLTYMPRVSGPAPAAVQAPPAAKLADLDIVPVRNEGSIVAAGPGTFARVVAGELEAHQPAKSQHGELQALIELRDTMAALLDVQARTLDDSDLQGLQERLNQVYDRYVARFGPIGRYKDVRTGRADPDTGVDLQRPLYPPMGGFRKDPDFPSVLALEDYDAESGTATKTAVFSRRVIGHHPSRESADNPAEALAISLDETGRVDLDRIGRLLDVEAVRARELLGTLVWADPDTGELVTAQRYLSGNVRQKLGRARQAAECDPAYAPNVAALEAVQPVDLTPDEIDARPGATWVGVSDVTAFLAETFQGAKVTVENTPVTAAWNVQVPTWQRKTMLTTSTWGTSRADAFTLFEKSLNQARHQVYDLDADGKRIVNAEETLLAAEKQQALSDRFAAWVWEDPARSERLAAHYNQLFNSIVLPVWDGSHQTFPGLSPTFKPRPHQVDAVWRAVTEPSVLLGHVVGAGKTATQVMAVMEMRRLGLVSKPAIVVPNHLVQQFCSETLQLYPAAKVLMAGRDEVSKERRKEFAARAATGDWDAIIITHSAFERIPVSPDTEAEYLEAEIASYRQAINASHEGSGLSVKQLETAVLKKEERLKTLRDDARRDDGVSFEQTGIDYLCVDEAHAFKNLAFPTNISGAAGGTSKRATDLDLKLRHIRETFGGRTATFATATFVANSIAEMWVMQHYLQPDELARAGVEHFDAWAATFGRTVSNLELAPDGGSYRIKERFASFANVPELLAMFRTVADVKTAEQLGLPTPDLVGGRQHTVVVPSSPTLRLYTQALAARAAGLTRGREGAKVDNMLKITGDGRRAALDLRLVGLPPDPGGGKIAAAAGEIAGIYHRNKDSPYPQAGARPGALQLVFCDLSTPGEGWNAYQELKDRLIDGGVPAAMIRFVHDSASDRQKADLFARARSGQIAVLIGSTQKMGVGTNVQARAIALHHIDAPWRPADMEQRDGRILRQGNLNDEVTISRYVTERSFDTFMYQTLERKSRFIHQVCQGDTDIARTVEDVSETTLSLAEVKALSTGNPLILEKAGIDNDVARLERLAASHRGEQRRAGRVITTGQGQLPAIQTRVDALQAAIARRVDVSGDSFAAIIDGHHFTKRSEAAAQLVAAIHQARHRADEAVPLGRIAGIDIEVRVDSIGGHTQLSVRPAGLYSRNIVLEAVDLKAVDPAGLLARVTNLVTGLETGLGQLGEQAERIRADIATAEAILQRPFDQAQQLAHLKARQADINETLSKQDENTDPAEKITYPPVEATPADWALFLAVHDTAAQPTDPPSSASAVATPGPHQQAQSQERTAGPDRMTTAELGDHVHHLRAALSSKRQALQNLDRASERLTDRIKDHDGPDHLLNTSLQQHSADRLRLQNEIAGLAQNLNAAQGELEHRPDRYQQARPVSAPAASKRSTSAVTESGPLPPGPVPPFLRAPRPGM